MNLLQKFLGYLSEPICTYTAQEASDLTKQAQEITASVAPTLEAYKAQAGIRQAETLLFTAGVDNFVDIETHNVQRLEKASEAVHEISENLQPRAEVAQQRIQHHLQSFQANVERLGPAYREIAGASQPTRRLKAA